MLWIIFLLSILIAFGTTQLSIVLSLRRGVLDVPNIRSSHSAPVPRIGGIGIVSAFYLSFAVFTALGKVGFPAYSVLTREVLAALLIGAGMAAIGLCDDLRGLNPAPKFLLQLFLAAIAVGLGSRVESLSIPLWGKVMLGVLSIPLTLLWLTGFANVYNFMDGIDGLAGGTGVVYGAFFFAIAWQQGDPGLAVVAVLLTGGCLGFLYHNFPQARTFMGDVGSLFLGMAFALFVVQLAQRSQNPASLVAHLMICSVYLYDSGFTLLRRIARRENIFRAHRSHLYQRMVQAGWNHGKVTAFYLVLHTLVGSLALLYLRVSGAAQLGIIGCVTVILLTFTLGVYWLEHRTARSKPADA